MVGIRLVGVSATRRPDMGPRGPRKRRTRPAVGRAWTVSSKMVGYGTRKEELLSSEMSN